MGPGCFHPRNECSRDCNCCGEKLQWGRDVSIPEMSRHMLSLSSPSRLQWGRDVSIPEMRVPRKPAAPLRSLQWGRDDSIPEMCRLNLVARGGSLLQWGRDVSIPEMPLPEGVTKRIARTSMGPGCFHPRN